MKLLFALPESVTHSGGGIITFYRHLLPWLAAQGHAVRVIAGSGVSAARTPSPRSIDGVQVEELDQGLLERYSARFSRYSALPGLRRFLAGAWAMWEQARGGEGLDLVESADWGLLFLPWVVEGGPPVIVQLHGSVGQIDLHDPVRGEEAQGTLIRMLERAGVERASRAQGCSQANSQFWHRQTGSRVDCLLPAWQPLLPHDGATRRTERGLVVGRVQRWKGPEVLCQALRLLGPGAPPVDWVGRDTAFETRNTTTSNHLGRQWPDVWGTVVTQQAERPFEQIARLQAAARFVVVPSLWDTFNFTCVEAMGAATPVICSTAAGASELIEDGVNGFTFESGDARSLATALEGLLGLDEDARRRLGEAGRQTVLRELDPDDACRRRLAAYQEVQRTGPGARLPSDDWLRQACEPGQDSQPDSLDFLDHLPLRSLVGHGARRVARKLRR
jgi:glycosyltransferase involved in cell wall biosynthesis